jgi:hypothetical protein
MDLQKVSKEQIIRYILDKFENKVISKYLHVNDFLERLNILFKVPLVIDIGVNVRISSLEDFHNNEEVKVRQYISSSSVLKSYRLQFYNDTGMLDDSMLYKNWFSINKDSFVLDFSYAIRIYQEHNSLYDDDLYATGQKVYIDLHNVHVKDIVACFDFVYDNIDVFKIDYNELVKDT